MMILWRRRALFDEERKWNDHVMPTGTAVNLLTEFLLPLLEGLNSKTLRIVLAPVGTPTSSVGVRKGVSSDEHPKASVRHHSKG